MVASGVSELPMVGGHPALDLVNTVEPRLPEAGRHEHLASPDDLLAWAQRAGLIDGLEAGGVASAWTAAPGSGSSALASVVRIREALFTALSAVLGADYAQPGTDQALEYLSMRWSAAVARSSLVLGGTGARLAVGSSPALLVPDRAAAAAVDLLCETDLGRLGICPPEHEGCGWLFLDRSRNGSRRWCTMDACGSQVKARRLTARRRAIRAPAMGDNTGSD
jgi:predicted RNA-binding Zn ribbon-like protein